MTTTIVLNPAAGRGRGARMRAQIERALPGAALLQTTRAGEAEQLAKDAVRQGAQLVVAGGGDGTVGEVLNGILGTGAKLGVLPLGTGNDFARCIGVGTKLEGALQVIQNGSSRTIDVGRVEIGGKIRYFLNVAGAGFDSRVAARINEHKPRILAKLGGTSAYLIACLAEMRRFPLAKVRLELDGKTIETRAVLCAVANASSYGGGMLVAPDADLSDGLFEVCLIKALSRGAFLRAFPSVFAGKHVHHPKVEMFRCSRVRLESHPELPVLVDGEIVGQTPASFEILLRAMEVMAPKADTSGKIR